MTFNPALHGLRALAATIWYAPLHWLNVLKFWKRRILSLSTAIWLQRFILLFYPLSGSSSQDSLPLVWLGELSDSIYRWDLDRLAGNPRTSTVRALATP